MDITITLNEEEIVTAIKDYLNTQDVPTAGKEVEVNMVAGRGANGHSAIVSVKKEEEKKELVPEAPVKPIKAAPEKKKETPASAPVPNPIPPVELFDDSQPVQEVVADENNVTEGDTLFGDPAPVNGQDTEVVSLFN